MVAPCIESALFQSTLPTRGSDYHSGLYGFPAAISIHAPHEGERHYCYLVPKLEFVISIHAPHEGERHGGEAVNTRQKIISIHAPHEGERRKPLRFRQCGKYFNPRSPRGGATV